MTGNLKYRPNSSAMSRYGNVLPVFELDDERSRSRAERHGRSATGLRHLARMNAAHVLAATTAPAALSENLQHVRPDFRQVDDVLQEFLNVEHRLAAARAAIEPRLDLFVEMPGRRLEVALVARLSSRFLLVGLLVGSTERVRLLLVLPAPALQLLDDPLELHELVAQLGVLALKLLDAYVAGIALFGHRARRSRARPRRPISPAAQLIEPITEADRCAIHVP